MYIEMQQKSEIEAQLSVLYPTLNSIYGGSRTG